MSFSSVQEMFCREYFIGMPSALEGMSDALVSSGLAISASDQGVP